MNPSSPIPALRTKGFSLTELLVVIALMAILMAAAVPGTNSLLENNNITQTGQLLADQFAMARQAASVRNRTVEIRLFKLPVQSTKLYSAVQLWAPDTTTGTLAPINRLVTFPKNVILSENSAYSPFLSKLATATMSATAGPMLANAAYATLRIRPNGIVEPTPANVTDRANLFFTVLNYRFATTTTLPNNYATVQLNPDTGSAQIYRP